MRHNPDGAAGEALGACGFESRPRHLAETRCPNPAGRGLARTVYPARESLFGGRHHRYLLPVRLLGAASRRERAHLPARRGAEAVGYRACLRCRPYRWPQSVSCTAPELVCRAVRLILAGALDRRSEAELGSRLGVSPRHLRRLFNAHLGLTPVGLARSARVHFARRLLDDTDLTLSEIALAAGFGSLRQFNRACQDVFRESPRMLRDRRRATDRLVADGGLLLRLPFQGPLDWDAMVAYFAARALPGVEHVS